jgi:hypothetical protein
VQAALGYCINIRLMRLPQAQELHYFASSLFTKSKFEMITTLLIMLLLPTVHAYKALAQNKIANSDGFAITAMPTVCCPLLA